MHVVSAVWADQIHLWYTPIYYFCFTSKKFNSMDWCWLKHKRILWKCSSLSFCEILWLNNEVDVIKKWAKNKMFHWSGVRASQWNATWTSHEVNGCIANAAFNWCDYCLNDMTFFAICSSADVLSLSPLAIPFSMLSAFLSRLIRFPVFFVNIDSKLRRYFTFCVTYF